MKLCKIFEFIFCALKLYITFSVTFPLFEWQYSLCHVEKNNQIQHAKRGRCFANVNLRKKNSLSSIGISLCVCVLMTGRGEEEVEVVQRVVRRANVHML